MFHCMNADLLCKYFAEEPLHGNRNVILFIFSLYIYICASPFSQLSISFPKCLKCFHFNQQCMRFLADLYSFPHIIFSVLVTLVDVQCLALMLIYFFLPFHVLICHSFLLFWEVSVQIFCPF